MAKKLHIQIIIGSTRPGRLGEQVAQWVFTQLRKDTHYTVELIDIAEYGLPLLDEANPPLINNYENPHTKAWARTISKADGYIIVTPEYNHAAPAALKNALDYLYKEWNDKAVGFVSYGADYGVRAVENLRLIAGELRLADVREQVKISLYHDFKDGVFHANERQQQQLKKLVDQLLPWTAAMRSVRDAYTKSSRK